MCIRDRMGIGGDGVISVIANAYPAEFSEMIRSASNGNYTPVSYTHLTLPTSDLV